MDTEKFIIRAKLVPHKTICSYGKTIFVDWKTKVIITCEGCGNDFEQMPASHLQKRGCPKYTGKNKTTEEFIKEAKLVEHSTEIGYDKTVYNGSTTKSTFTCLKCNNDFLQTPNNHLAGKGCSICSDTTKTTEEFIKEAKLVPHKTRIGYDKFVYINKRTKGIFTCLDCGNDFEQLPDSHLDGCGCPKCSGKNKTTEEFIKEAKLIPHKTRIGYDKSVYVDSYTKIIFTCLDCKNDFKQLPSNHLIGHGCPICADRTKTTEEFIKEAKLIPHTTEIGYDKFVYVNCRTKGIFTCLKCEEDFLQTPNTHLRGKGCPRCKESKGEKAIRKFLSENNILFDDQYWFQGCRYINPLPFDFVLLDENNNCKALIEYQGKQHYIPTNFGSSSMTKEEHFECLQRNDKIKLDYTINNNIPLLRIHYKDYKNIPILLEKFII